jgi:hypothetical protein
MSNLCDYSVVVHGPREHLETLKAMILKDTKPIEEGPNSGDFLFNLEPATWGDLADSHEWLWLRRMDYYRCESILDTSSSLGVSSPDEDELHIGGTSRWCPPLVFASRIIELFARVNVDVRGTTEHEHYEHWQSEFPGEHTDRPRTLVCREERIENLQTGEIVRLTIGGRQILPSCSQEVQE